MTLKIKLILAAIIAALVGYSYLWTYWQGQKTCKSAVLEAQIEALSKSLVEQERYFRDQRQREMREAAETAKQLLHNEKRKVKDLEAAKKLLQEKSNVVLANSIVPVDAIRLLNSSRGDNPTTPSS